MRRDDLRVWQMASVVLGVISALLAVWAFLIQPYRDESRATERHVRELVAAELRVREIEGRGQAEAIAALQSRFDGMAADVSAVKAAVAVVEERTRFLEDFVRSRNVSVAQHEPP